MAGGLWQKDQGFAVPRRRRAAREFTALGADRSQLLSSGEERGARGGTSPGGTMSSAPEAESASSASSMPQFDEPGGIRPVMTSYDQGGAQYGLARNFKMNTGGINL